MKQALLFLVFMLTSFSSFSQSSEMKIEEMELQQLDEVVINYYDTTRVEYAIICSQFGAYCCVGIEVVEDANKMEDIKPQIEVLYPNPSSSGFFNLKFTKDYKMVTVNVYTMTGQFIQSEKMKSFSRNISIDLSQFSKGIYLLELIADGVKLPTKKAVFR